MTRTCDEVGRLVLKIQEAFLDDPRLALTRRQASRRFRVDMQTAGEILELLAESEVLTQRGDETYATRPPRFWGGIQRVA